MIKFLHFFSRMYAPKSSVGESNSDGTYQHVHILKIWNDGIIWCVHSALFFSLVKTILITDQRIDVCEIARGQVQQ